LGTTVRTTTLAREVAALAGAAVGAALGWAFGPAAYIAIASDFADRREVARTVDAPAVALLLKLVGSLFGAIAGGVVMMLLAAGVAAALRPLPRRLGDDPERGSGDRP
jgi:hypothetical protein